MAKLSKQRDWLADRLRDAAEIIRSPIEQPLPETAPAAEDYKCVGAQNEDEAHQFFLAAKESDPFPEIHPALLNSAHIEDYMIETAMVFPYHRERRKTASYAMRIGPWKAFWDPSSADRDIPFHTLQERETFVLPPNSLVYVKTKEIFQLPNYMAVRFNLHIDLVHKGLLLGTGPLVDPGFRGHLLVPLHNMTANTYILAENDEFIWAEFTKTSMTDDWKRAPKDAKQPSADFAEFPADKYNQPVDKYLAKAMRPHALAVPRVSYPFPANAIPKAVEEARTLAHTAEAQASVAGNSVERIRRWGYAAGLAITVSLVGLVFVTWQMMQSTITMVDSSNNEVRSLKAQVGALQLAHSDKAIEGVKQKLLAYCALPASNSNNAPARLVALHAYVSAARVANSAARAAGQGEPFELADMAGANSPECPNP